MLLIAKVSMTQDSLIIMQYNMLRYGSQDLSVKDSLCLPVIAYVNPDILCINEVLPDYPDSLERALKTIDTSWTLAPWSNVSGGTVVNVLLYKKDKVSFIKQRTVETLVRDIPVYWLSVADSLTLIIAVAHLKAGSSTTNEQQRRWMVEALLDSLSAWNVDKWILAGDLNFYTADDTSYQLLTNHPDPRFRLVDPFPAGTWNNNALFSLYHTQSTRDTLLSDGGATGGLDDRFDFILPSVRYFEPPFQWDTFYVFGQDGNHFNKSILDPPPIPVPDSIARSLYFCADHLPVIAVLSLPTQLSSDTIISSRTPSYFHSQCQIISPHGTLLSTINNCQQILGITTITGRHIKVNNVRVVVPQNLMHQIILITYEQAIPTNSNLITHVKILVTQ